jgi:flavin-dependent dehydrogenase
MFDVVVCGAGPAGSIAATVLARGGARVLLLDRARFPRPKLCGDTLNPGTLALLRRLGLADSLPAASLRLEGMIVTGERGASVTCRYGPGVHGLAMARHDLDAALMRTAVGAGVRFEEGVLVRGPLVDHSRPAARVRGVVLAGRDGRDLRVPAPLVIAADGGSSRLARALGLAASPARPRRWAIGTYFDGVSCVGAFGEMHVRRGRYIGVAPAASGTVNVCLVVPRGVRLDEPAGVLRRTIADDAALRDRFASARMLAAPVVLGPLAVDVPVPGAPGLLLAGDAAGFIDPMTGDGLRFAIRGGELAGEVALAAFAGHVASPHQLLERLRRREFARKWRFNRTVRALVARAPAVDLASAATWVAPWALRRAIAFAGDVPRT